MTTNPLDGLTPPERKLVLACFHAIKDLNDPQQQLMTIQRMLPPELQQKVEALFGQKAFKP